jgi:hypothetical protein
VLLEIAAGIDLQAVPVHQILHAIGKLVDIGHRGVFHQDRNDWDPVAEGRLDFDTDWIRWIVDAAAPPWQRSKPTFADDDKSNICLSKYAIYVFSEIDANWDVIDIPKYRISTIISDKTIEYPPGNPGGIISPIGNCYPCHFKNLRIV